MRGGGELASAAARLLHLCGGRVAVLERAQPLAVRRLVSYAEAIVSGRADVEGVPGQLVEAAELEAAMERGGFVAVAVDPDAATVMRVKPQVIVDGRMRKGIPDSAAPIRAFLVGLGPGFSAGRDADAVVETQRGPDLGRVLWSGSAEADTKVPMPVLGHTERRVLRATRDGVFHPRVTIGSVVAEGAVVAETGGQEVVARIGGLLRGLLAAGVFVGEGTKVGDVDPRGAAVDPRLVSDKGRAVAAGVVEAIAIGLGKGR